MMIPNTIGIVFGLLLWGVLWYLHFTDSCPLRHSILIGGIATAQIALSSGLILQDPTGWQIIGYLLLTGVGLALAFEGRYEMMVEETADMELTTDTNRDKQ